MRKFLHLKKRGFTLIEIIVVIVITSILFPMMMMLLGNMTAQMTKSKEITIATDLAREMMEIIGSKRFDENIRTDPAVGSWTAVASLGPDSGETGLSTYDDKDDFNGYSDTPLPAYTRNVTVIYVAPTNYTSASGSPTDYKKITVTVTNSHIGTIRLETLAGGWGN